MSERNDRKVYVGKVVSDKMDKTITVLLKLTKHTNYTVKREYSKKYKTHDENNSAKLETLLQ